MQSAFAERIDQYLDRVTARLDAALPAADTEPVRLHSAMRYAVLDGGKRIRPLLVYAAGECLGLDESQLDAPAAAIELIHAFSLVHDDLPAMDDDELRRGKPTLHCAYDEATAILAADALQPLAFSVIASIDGVAAEPRNRLVSLLANACGSLGMTGGQSLDLAAEGQQLDASDIEAMYALKTGALIHAAVMSACALREDLDTTRAQALDAFARAVGVAFQIRDDILDVEGESSVIGKPAGSDVKLDKATYPSLIGLDAAKARCHELLDQGLAYLDVFADDADALRWLARYIVSRGN